MLLVVPFLFFEIVERPNIINILFTNLSLFKTLVTIFSFFWAVFVQMVLLLSITRMAFFDSGVMPSFLNALNDAKNHLYLPLILIVYNFLSDLLDLNANNYAVYFLNMFVFLITLVLISMILLLKYTESSQKNAEP
jgi:hypothetical protein